MSWRTLAAVAASVLVLLTGCAGEEEPPPISYVEREMITQTVLAWAESFGTSDVAMSTAIGESDRSDDAERERWVWFGDGPMLLSTRLVEYSDEGTLGCVNYMFYPAKYRFFIGECQSTPQSSRTVGAPDVDPYEIDLPVDTDRYPATEEQIERFMFWADTLWNLDPESFDMDRLPNALFTPVSVDRRNRAGEDVFVVEVGDWVLEVTASVEESTVTGIGNLDDPGWVAASESLIEVNWRIDRVPFEPEPGDPDAVQEYLHAIEADADLMAQLEKAGLTTSSLPFEVRTRPETYPISLD